MNARQDRQDPGAVARTVVPGGAEAGLLRRALLTALMIVTFGCLYFFVRQFLKDGVWLFDPALVNKSLGISAFVLITLSMFLTSWSAFAKGSGRSLPLRKYVGLTGFWLGLAHGAVDHLLMPALGLSPEKGSGARHADAVGLAALVLFAAMAIVSNERARRLLGTKSWRALLRYAGYAGLVLTTAHAALLKWGSWSNYVRTFDPVLPSLSLPAALFAAATVLLRLGLEVSRRRKA